MFDNFFFNPIPLPTVGFFFMFLSFSSKLTVQAETTVTFSFYSADEKPSFLNQKQRTAVLKANPFSILLAAFHVKAKGKHYLVKYNKLQQSCLTI